jgi:small conductance mechanosensitive channel
MTNQIFQLDTLQHAKQKVVDLSIEFGPKVAAALLIMVIGFFVARWAGGIFQRWLSKIELEPPVRELLLRVMRAVIFLLFMLMAVQQLGFALAPVLAGLGVAGAGIALAMQGVLGNLAAGLLIIFTKPFRVGEYVSMAGVEGRVEAIELFNTKLGHPDLSRIVVPNRKIVGDILHNYGKIRQLDVVVGVAYNTDLNAAMTAINQVLSQNARVLKEPSAVVRVRVLADSSINIEIKPWVNVPDYGPAVGEVNKAIVEAFRARNISIPFPQREVRLLNAPEQPKP